MIILIQVLKRDGTTEAWATGQGANGPVSSSEIKTHVEQALQAANPAAATAYSQWKKQS